MEVGVKNKAAFLNFWGSRMAGFTVEVLVWVKADTPHKCFAAPIELKADMAMYRREHRGDITEHHTEARCASMIEVVPESGETEEC